MNNMINIFRSTRSLNSSQLLFNTTKLFCGSSIRPFDRNFSNQQENANLNNVNNKESIIDNSFAVVQLAGKQYKVIKGDVIMSDRIHVDVGEHIILDKVLLVGTKDQTMIGTPLVDGVHVHAYIEEQSKAPKVTIFKRKRRKNYMRTTAFTPLATVLRIGDIFIQK